MDVGVEKLITNQRKFEQALTCGACFCCRAEAFIHNVGHSRIRPEDVVKL